MTVLNALYFAGLVIIWFLSCVSSVFATTHATYREECEPLTGVCVQYPDHDTASKRILERYLELQGVPVTTVGEVVEPSDAVTEEPLTTVEVSYSSDPSTPSNTEGIRISWLFDFDDSRSNDEIEMVRDRLMPAAAKILAKSMRVRCIWSNLPKHTNTAPGSRSSSVKSHL